MKIQNCILAVLFWLGALGQLQGQTPGSLRWSFVTGDSVYSSPAIAADNTIYIGSFDGKLYALTSAGTQKWTFSTGGQIVSSPAIGLDGTVYFGCTDNKLYALNRDGQLKWSFTTGGSIYLCSPGMGLDGTIYIGSLDQNVYALKADGTKKWAFATGAGIYSSPIVGADGVIYCASIGHKLFALNPDGTEKWEFVTAAEVFSSPAIGPKGEIYVASGGIFYAIHPSGTNLWQYTVGGAIYSSAAVKADGSVYFGSTDGILHALNSDGTKLWDAVITNAIHYSSPALGADGMVYVSTLNNKLYAIDSGGKQQWIFTADNPLSFGEPARNWAFSSPAIGPDGAIYVGYNNAKLYAVNGTKGLARAPWPMFRRDLRHSGSGFATRQLPAGYSPGLMLTVTLASSPPVTSSFYSIEEQIPSGWTIGAMNYNGTFDAPNQKVRFGPFFDSTPRTFSYQATPPLTDTGLKVFGGAATANDWESFIGGNSSLSMVPTLPADNQPIDFRLTITELTAYGKAWKNGGSWPIGPNPVPVAYVAGAANLWRGGEYYAYSTNLTNAFFWVPATNPAPAGLPTPSAAVLNDATIIASLPSSYTPDVPFSVNIMVTPPTNAAVYALEDQPPQGWTVSALSGDGQYDPINQVVKWGPYFDGNPRALTYTVTPAANSAAIAQFAGLASFDGVTLPIGGQREIATGGNHPPVALRRLPLAYVPGQPLTVTLNVLAPADAAACVVADQPPAGWGVGSISSNGAWDATNHLVKFVVFPSADATPQVFTYNITPPATESATNWFVGSVSLDGLLETVQGDSMLVLSTYFPADINPIDSRLSVEEMVAYDAAWLQNNGSWPMAPIPISLDYLSRAIMLWRGGEAYRHDESIANPPLDWVNATPQTPFNIVPPTSWNTNLGMAFTLSPLALPMGVASPVTIQIICGNSTQVYAIEDQPPNGWQVTNIDNNGIFDAVNHKVKWGPFFGDNGRIVQYWVTPSQPATGTQGFAGIVAFKGGDIPIDHQFQFTLPRLRVVQYSLVDGVTLELSSPVGRYYQLQSSSDLLNWQLLSLITNYNGVVQFTDPNSVNNLRQYYRAYSPNAGY